MKETLTKENLSILIDEVEGLKNTVLLAMTEEKIAMVKESCATMPVYDNETMAKREFFRGVVSGMEWFTKDIHDVIDQVDKLLQKKEK